MKKMRILFTMLLLWAGVMNVAAQITVHYVDKGSITIDGVDYYLYEGHWVVDYTLEEFMVSQVASVHQFYSNVPEEVVIPSSVTKDGITYPVSSVRYDYEDNYARWTISSNKVKVLKFEDSIGFHHGISKEKVFNLPNLTDIYFTKTPSLGGWPYAELFGSPDSLTITVHLKDKTKAQADSLKQHAPWSGFKKIIGSSPTRLLITANMTNKNIEVWSDNAQECSIPSTGGTVWKDISKTEYIQFRIPNQYLEKIIINGDDVTTTLPSSTPTDLAYQGYTFYTLNDFTDLTAVEFKFRKGTTNIIHFADANVKAICVANWDTDGDGELSVEEAAAVTTLKKDNGDGTFGASVFKSNKDITSFDELQYFTGLTQIESEAFRGCNKLEKITLPDGLTNIGTSSFDETGLTSLNIPESVTQIQGYAFTRCRSLKYVTLPNGITSIGTQAFAGCGFVSFEVPASVTNLGSTVTSGPNLISVSVDPVNTKYDSRDDCNAIINTSTNELITGCKYTKIPEGVVKIGGYAFSNSPIESIEIPSTVTSIDYGAFSYSNIKSVVCKGTTPPTLAEYGPFSYISSECVLTVPKGTRDAYIAAGWTTDIFKGGVVEEEPASEIIEFADNNVKAICVENWDTNGDGELSKAEAAAVTTLKVMNADKSVYASPFKENETITSFDELQYFTSLTDVCDSAFNSCKGLKSVIIPKNVTNIKRYGFNHCTALESIQMPEGLLTIGQYAFWCCLAMPAVHLPESVTQLEQHAFAQCNGLRTIKLPNGLIKVGSALFGCSGLQSIYIPANLTDIDKNFIGDCTSLISISVAPNNPVYDTRNGCNALIKTSTNTLVTGCKYTVIPEGVEEIGYQAYYSSWANTGGLDSVLIPKSVKTIAMYAFANRALKSVICKCETPPTLDRWCFSGIGNNCVLTVPKGTKQAYIEAGWTDGSDGNTAIFKEIVEDEEIERFDVNRDGHVSIADVTTLVNVILGKPIQ